MTIDEELTLLESQLRRLKIEYEIYFSNPTKKPPTDVEWKVLSLLRKFSDGARMGIAQRFRYNEMAQRYAIYSDLWRKKGRIREEGYRRPQDALLSIQGLRAENNEPERRVYGVSAAALAAVAASRTGLLESSFPTLAQKRIRYPSSITLLLRPRKRLARTFQAISTASPLLCRRKPNKSANNTAVPAWNIPWRWRTARSG